MGRSDQLSDLHVYSLAGLGEHTHAMHDTPPPHWPMAHCALQRAQRPHRTHAAAQRVSATQEARGDTRTHGLAPPPAPDRPHRSQRPPSTTAWTERTAHNAHKHNGLGRSEPLTTPTSSTTGSHLNTIVFMNTELNTGVIKVFELKYPGYKSFRLEYSYLLRPHYS